MMEECCRICGECISSRGFALCVRVQGTVPEWGKGMLVQLTMVRALICEGDATEGVDLHGQIQNVWGVMVNLP